MAEMDRECMECGEMVSEGEWERFSDAPEFICHDCMEKLDLKKCEEEVCGKITDDYIDGEEGVYCIKCAEAWYPELVAGWEGDDILEVRKTHPGYRECSCEDYPCCGH